jgi:hypothetical protein
MSMDRGPAFTMPLDSALFQASVFLSSAYPLGSQEHQIADICGQAAMALEELEQENEPLKQAVASSDDNPMSSVDVVPRDSEKSDR